MVRGSNELHVLFPQLMERLHNPKEIQYHAAKIDQSQERLQLAIALRAFEGKNLLCNYWIRFNSVSRYQMPEKLYLGCDDNWFCPVHRHVLLFQSIESCQ